MFRKLAIGISCIITVAAAAALAGCGGSKDYDAIYSDKVKVVYELEGGKYGNSTTNVKMYYDYDGNPRTIKALDDKVFAQEGKENEKVVMRDGGFELEGWYTTKTLVEGKAEYSGKWDFAKDTVTKDGVTLYAKWKSPIKYTFDFVYLDAGGAEKVVKSYEVNAGQKFSTVYPRDVLSYATGYAGHTAVGVYYDAEHTDPYDDTRVPVETGAEGEEKGGTVKLYVDYIEGSYAVVRTAAELKAAKKNVYLLADIDLQGNEFKFDNFNKKTLLGNGHRIYNFTFKYGAGKEDLVPNLDDGNNNAIFVALFGKLENAEVVDVKFEDVTVTVNASYSAIRYIYVAPLAVSAKDCKFEKVSFTGTFGYETLPDPDAKGNEFDIDNLIFVTDKGAYKCENSTETDCSYDIKLENNQEQ